jgi:hypothetical protein
VNDNVRVGTTALELAQALVRAQPIARVSVEVVRDHPSFRETYATPKLQLEHIAQAFHDYNPEQRLYTRTEFLRVTPEDLDKLCDGEGYACFNSLVKCEDGQDRHIPLAHFRRVDGIPSKHMLAAVTKTFRMHSLEDVAYLLTTKNSIHLYGEGLLEHADWMQFTAKLARPMVHTNPSWATLRIAAGYGSLRITETETKPVPRVQYIAR